MLAACLLSLVVAAGAEAQEATTGSAQALYSAGDWQASEQRAATGSDASSKTLAAQSILARLMAGEMAGLSRHERRAAALSVQTYALAALDLDGDYAPAHLRLAAGLGYEARYRSALRAAMARLPQRGREHIDRAIALDREDPWAFAMLGAWHLEVARQGGEGTFGSSIQEGLDAYRHAVSMGDLEPAIAYHFALALIALDPSLYQDEAQDLLAQAIESEPRDAFDDTAQLLATELSAQFTQAPNEAQALAIERLEQ